MKFLDMKHFLKPLIEEDLEFYDWDATVIAKFLEEEDFYKQFGFNQKVLNDMVNAIAAFLKDPSMFLNSEINYLNFCKAMVGEPLSLTKIIHTDENGMFIGTLVMISLLDLVKELNSDDYFVTMVAPDFKAFLRYLKEHDIADYILKTFDEEGFLLTPYPLNMLSRFCSDSSAKFIEDDLKMVNSEDMMNNLKSVKAILPSLNDVAKEEIKRHITLQTTYKYYSNKINKK